MTLTIATPAAAPIKSYTSTRGLLAHLREFTQLYRWHTQNLDVKVRMVLGRMREMEERIRAAGGPDCNGLRMLDVGPGQQAHQFMYFGMRNDVVGIDLDEIAEGLDVGAYWRMLRANGPVRVAKTIGRKAVGLDRRFARALCRELNAERLGRTNVLQMDATAIEFPDASFDVVYSFSVFEHLPEPAKVLREIRRVLKPGGCAYVSLHLFTSDNGCHDIRLLAGNHDELPYWPHLRDGWKDQVRPNAYLNKLRIPDWNRIFGQEFPGFSPYHNSYGRETLEAELRKLRDAGELMEYADEELVTSEYVAVWRKPAE